MTILQVHKYYWPRDGASNYMLQLEGLLQGKGHTVIPFAMQQAQTLDTPYAEYFVSEMNLADPAKATFGQKMQYATNMLYSKEAAANMARLLDDHTVDIAHIHNIYHHISPSILVELKKRNIPVVMTLHDYKLIGPNYSLFHHGQVHEEDATGWYLSCIKNKCFKDSRMQSALVTAEMVWHHKIKKYYERCVDMCIAPSQFMADMCIKHGWPKEKMQVIAHPFHQHATSNVSEEKGYVAYVGRLSEEKGVGVLVEAAAHMPEIPVKIIGSGPQQSVLEQQIEKQGSPNIELVGFQTGNALQTLINEARIIVVPSIWYENYPLSILEAKTAGKIVIGSNMGGIPELLPQELLVEPRDAKALATKIQQWYRSSEKERETMGERLKGEVHVYNDPQTHIAAIESVYAHIA